MTDSIEIQKFALWQKLRDKNLPTSFSIEITARCNLNCRHCYINLPVTDATARQSELGKDVLLDLSRQATELGAVWCLITGGEPFLRKDFADIYLGLKRLGLLVSIFTNGTLLQSEHIDLLTQYPPRDIEITVYGASEKIYEQVTRLPGSYKRFRHGLDLLRAADLPVRLKAVALRSNYSEFDDIARFCREYTKDYFRYDPQLHLRYDRNPLRNTEILAERLTPEEIVALENADDEKMRALIKNCTKLSELAPEITASHNLFRCGAGNGSFTIGYDGQFRLCSSLCAPQTTCDLKTIPLAKAWKELVPAVRGLRPVSPTFSENCGICPVINLCLWCPAHSYLETGSLDSKVDFFCEVAHMRAENIKKNSGKISE